MTVLPIAYFPPISYFSLLAGGEILLEANENYQKQTWRNRCNILTANGVESLQVPVVHENGTFRHPIRDVKVDYSRDWMQRHKRAIDSAYMSSAYFEFYRDRLYAVLDRRPESLWELDLSIINFFVEIYRLKLPAFTEEFVGASVEISPKKTDPVYVRKPYWQVFSTKFDFVPNLSIMDLLFNEGPEYFAKSRIF